MQSESSDQNSEYSCESTEEETEELNSAQNSKTVKLVNTLESFNRKIMTRGTKRSQLPRYQTASQRSATAAAAANQRLSPANARAQPQRQPASKSSAAAGSVAGNQTPSVGEGGQHNSEIMTFLQQSNKTQKKYHYSVIK